MTTLSKSHLSKIDAIVGDSIRQVIYYSPENNSNTLARQTTPSHTINKALLFRMQSGAWYGFFHGTEFGQQGIDVVFNPYELTKIASNKADFLNASHHRNWTSIVGQTILSTDPIWYEEKYPTSSLYPQALRITFENRATIYICVPKSSSETISYWNLCEDVMIIFDERLAKGYLTLVK